MTLPQKILFTAVFTVYWFIFYGIAYYALAWWDPGLLEIPQRLSQTHVLSALAIFTGLVFLAYVGASFVVLGRLPRASAGGRGFREGSQTKRRRGPAPGDRLRSSRRFFGGTKPAKPEKPRTKPPAPRRSGRSGTTASGRPARNSAKPGPENRSGPRSGAGR